MHDQLMAVIARPTCSLVLDLVMAVVCRFLRVRRTFDCCWDGIWLEGTLTISLALPSDL